MAVTLTEEQQAALEAAAAAGWIVDGTNVHLITVTNKVGIGTDEPTSKLYIVQDGDNSTSGIMIEGTGGGTGRFYHSNSNTVVIQKGTNIGQIVLNANGTVAFSSNIEIKSVNGIDIGDSNDTDQDLITVSVTGAPKIFWDESANAFAINKNLTVAEDFIVDTSLIFADKSNGTVTIGKSSTGTDRFNVFGPGSGFAQGIASFYDSAAASNIKFRFRDQATASGVPPRLETESSLGMAFNTTTNSKYVWYLNGTGNERMRLEPSGLTVNDFTKLGSTAPNIKMKKLTGTTGASEGDDTDITHGLTLSKIISLQVLVTADNGNKIPPSLVVVDEYEFDTFLTPTTVTVALSSANSANLTGNAITILLTYEA